MTVAKKRALEAFAEPIRAHAREWAAGVVDSIAIDVRHGESISVAYEVEHVSAPEAWLNSDFRRLRVPDGATEWARDEWCHAFAHELERLAAEHEEATGDAFVRRHLRDLGARP